MHRSGSVATRRLDHVALAVEQWEHAWGLYVGELGGQWVSGNHVQGFAPSRLRYANGGTLELLAPHREDEDPFLRRFLQRHGPGPHHLTFYVDSIIQAREVLSSRNIALTGSRHSFSSTTGRWEECFVLPSSGLGALIQLVEVSGPEFRSPAPPALPVAGGPSRMLRACHVVPSLDEGLDLYAGSLGGQECGRGAAPQTRWVDLQWPESEGELRLRTWEVADDGPPIEPGIQQLDFACADPSMVVGAIPSVSDGSWQVRAAAACGIELRLEQLP